MKVFENILKRLEEYKKLSSYVNKSYLPIGVTGVSGVHKAHIIHSLHRERNKKIFVIAFDEVEANRLVDDLSFMGNKVFMYNSRDFNFRDIEDLSSEYSLNRIEVLSKLLNKDFDIVISCLDAFLQYTIPKDYLIELSFTLKTEEKINLKELNTKLLKLGYENTSKVEGKGQFNIRGGILDLFSPGEQFPVRIELFGDTVETISYFDIDTQRRSEKTNQVNVIPAYEVIIEDHEKLSEKIEQHSKTIKGKQSTKARQILMSEAEKIKNGVHINSKDKFITMLYESPATLFDYISSDDILIMSEPTKVRDRYNSMRWQWNEDIKSYFESGILCKGLEKYLEDFEYVNSQLKKHGVIYLDTFIHNSYEVPVRDTINFTASQNSTWSGSLNVLADDLDSIQNKQSSCIVLAGTERAARSVYDDLWSMGFEVEYKDNLDNIIPGKIFIMPGSLSTGFEYPSIGVKLITHGRFHKPKKNKRNKAKKDINSLNSLSELNEGDYVVHFSHGIGIFRGIKKITMNDVIKDYITIEYSNNDTLYVPVTQLDLVSKYIGSREDSSLRLSKLGSSDWKRTKSKVKSNVQEIADHLINLYAERLKTKGYAFSKDNAWQKDFESHFEYEETQDQLRCIAEIKEDMESNFPMDRLLCGDVGFGKTEVAMRAAFKCVSDSKQCAMLVPTTILAWQHYQTIVRRFEGFSVKVELLSRFRNLRQQKEIVKKLKQGEIDIVVGTHRLVQEDVKFRDLGLLIIDEEQRFGVRQKEFFKNTFSNVDILTLSATPIPRTLNMALSGIRDMSMLEEAPQDRYPVQTYVLEHDVAIIHEAIRKEIRRGGQVFYLYNRVEGIENVAAIIQEEIPEAKVGIGHGKMSENELGDVWKKMIDQEINVLICTTIIETGIDLPNANTLIIENADRMGLSQLHQLRGRVGRSSRRSYAYLTFKRNKVLSEISQRRLSSIREFTEFGSGFKIAMRDLELRGAGNLLGGEQHGYMSDVGYDMYIKLLNDAVSERKGEIKKNIQTECLVDIQIPAYISEKYISAMSERVSIYRRISDIRTQEDVKDVIDELIDRFGKPPEAVIGLIEVAVIRSLAINNQVKEIKQRDDDLLLFQDKIDIQFVSKLISKFGNKVKMNASEKPFVSIRLENGEDPTDILRKALT